MHAPFEAHTGTDPYIFVSYAHRDSALVFPVITAWHQAGRCIWYDEGIDPGNEWPEEIANALAGASQFIVFVTPRSVESKNVRNEINFALDHGKEFIAIHLEETSLPAGLHLRMGDIQAIMKYRMTQAMFDAKMNKVLLGGTVRPVPPAGAAPDVAGPGPAAGADAGTAGGSQGVKEAVRRLRVELSRNLAREIDSAREEMNNASGRPRPPRTPRRGRRTVGCLSMVATIAALSVAFYFLYTRVIMKFSNLSSRYLSASCPDHRNRDQKLAYLKKLSSEGDRDTRIAELEQELVRCENLSYARQRARREGLDGMSTAALEEYYLKRAPASHAERKIAVREFRNAHEKELRPRLEKGGGSRRSVLEAIDERYRSLLMQSILDMYEEEAPR